jgi:hypothetical protein
MNSSPPRPSTYTTSGRKERRDPSVTPRKFRRFFTPRSHGNFNSSSRQALYDITAPALNRNAAQSSPLRPFRGLNGPDSSPVGFSRELKRRKLIHTPEASPEHNSKARTTRGGHGGPSRIDNLVSSPCERAAPDMDYINEEEEETDVEEPDPPKQVVKRVVRLSERGLAGQMLNMSLGVSYSSSRRQHYEYPTNGMLLVGHSQNIWLTISQTGKIIRPDFTVDQKMFI